MIAIIVFFYKHIPYRSFQIYHAMLNQKNLTPIAIGLMILLGLSCKKESELNPTSSSSSQSTANSSTDVPDTSFVKIQSNASFKFITTTTNSGTGENSPIANDYYLNKYLVSNTNYKKFCDATNHKVPSYWKNNTYPSGKENHPVLYVSYNDALDYCAWLGTLMSGYTFRLPTEAEWENAASGPNKNTWPWGNEEQSTYTNGVLSSNFNYNGVCSAYYLSVYGTTLVTNTNTSSSYYNTSAVLNTILSIKSTGGVSGWKDETNLVGFAYTDLYNQQVTATGGFTTPVNQYPKGKSYYGLCDMAGNAWTWTSSTIVANNGGEKGQSVNAIRGGSWYSNGSSCKTSYRGEGRSPSGFFNSVGFRVAATKK